MAKKSIRASPSFSLTLESIFSDLEANTQHLANLEEEIESLRDLHSELEDKVERHFQQFSTVCEALASMSEDYEKEFGVLNLKEKIIKMRLTKMEKNIEDIIDTLDSSPNE